MIQVKRTKNPNLIKSIVTHPDLFELAGHVGNTKSYKPYLGNLWLTCHLEDKIVGLYVLEKFTAISSVVHCYILPEYQGILSVECAKAVIDYLKNNTSIKNVIVTTPVQCIHVLKHIQKLGFLLSGFIKNGIIYKNHLQDLSIYQLEI